MLANAQMNERIDFNDLLARYKRDNFKTMPMIDHEFLYACYHPLSDDFVLCLERNIFPTSLHMSELSEIQYNEDGQKTTMNA